MIGVVIIPTGINAEIGGHAGDANPVAKLIGACCDKLILHPNVVNASDINEMPENALYVEGSILDRFLEGQVQLREVTQNRILVAVNKPVRADTINAVSAARATIGAKTEIVELDTPFRMVSRFDSGIATGDVHGAEELVEQILPLEFDALAIHSTIEVDRDVALDYYDRGGLNPWGGVEAVASRMVANRINKPVAHAPLEGVSMDDKELYNIFQKAVDPRIAAEVISLCYLHCVLKGLNKAPRLSKIGGISCYDVDFLISPSGCFDRPHYACFDKNIPVIVVEENKTCQNKQAPDRCIKVRNYWEAAGIVMSMQAGINPSSVRRPVLPTWSL